MKVQEWIWIPLSNTFCVFMYRLCVGSRRVWTQTVCNYKVTTPVHVRLKCIYHKCPTCKTTVRTAITQKYFVIIMVIIW